MAATRLIAIHQHRGKTVQESLKARLDYAMNGEKTDGGKYVSAYACNPDTVDQEFALSKVEYYRLTGRKQSSDIIAYQIRQSFKPGEITPEEANKVGYETAMRFTKGDHAFIVATHIDKAHIHNHIIFNSTSLDCTHKFRDAWFVALALQRLSDIICLEHGLSVIEKTKPHGKSQDEKKYEKKPSIRMVIRADIDRVLASGPKTFEEFLELLRGIGYKVKTGKHIAVQGKGQKRFVRLDSLGEGYTEQDLRKRFEKEKTAEEKSDGSVKEKSASQSDRSNADQKGTGSENGGKGHVSTETRGKAGNKDQEPPFKPHRVDDFDFLIDIQEKISEGKIKNEKGFETWAKRFNLKDVAKSMVYAQEHGVRRYADLEKMLKEKIDRYHEIQAQLKEKEARLKEIAETKKHIINYSKTKDVYDQYRRSGYNAQFFEEHRQEILLHKAAKKKFDEIQARGEKIPKVKELSKEYAEILAEKRKLYQEYKTVREEMRNYQKIKYNVDRFEDQDFTKDRDVRNKNEEW